MVYEGLILTEEEKDEYEGKVIIIDKNTKRPIVAVAPNAEEITRARERLNPDEIILFYFTKKTYAFSAVA